MINSMVTAREEMVQRRERNRQARALMPIAAKQAALLAARSGVNYDDLLAEAH